MEVEMADIRSDVTQPAEAHHGIHIGPVDIDLTAMGMDDLANAPYARLKHSVS